VEKTGGWGKGGRGVKGYGLVMRRGASPWTPAVLATPASVRPFGARDVTQEPQTSIRPAKEVDVFPAEIETSQTELGDCLDPIERMRRSLSSARRT
jgi:hypothetical protein